MNKRVQVNTDLGQPEALRTTARPTRNAAPVYSVAQSRGAALAQSLLSIAPTLQGYVQEFQQDYQEQEETRAYDTIQGMTFDEAQEAVKSGAMRDTESPWYQAAFEKQFGTVYAQRRRRELIDAYNNEFDKHNGNLDEFIAEFAGQDLEAFGGSEFIMAGYRNAMGGTLGQLRDTHAEWTSNWTRERTTENFGRLVYDDITNAVANGEDLNSVLSARTGETRSAFGTDFKTMDGEIFNAARRLAAEGNVEALEALLSTERVGPDGTKIGSYATRPQFAEESAKLLEEARAVSGSKKREENTATIVGLQQQAASGNLDLETATNLRDEGQISLGEFERLVSSNSTARVRATVSAQNQQMLDTARTQALSAVVSGQAFAIQDLTYTDASGNSKTISRDDLVEGAVVDTMNELAKRQTPPAVMAEQLSSYGVDVKYPVWENLLSDGYLTLTTAGATGDNGSTEVPDTAMAAFATYKALADTPHIRSRHINNADAEYVWSTAALLEQMGYETEDALSRAASPASEAGQARANAFSREEFQALSRSVKPGWFGEEMSNGASALGQTEALARFYVSHGVPAKKAVEAAVEDYEASHTTINGASVNTRNVHLGNNFEDASLVFLQDFAEMHDEDVDDLTLVPTHDGSNNWMVAYKGNVAMPVQIQGADNVVHHSQIERLYANVSAELEAAAEAEAFAAAQAEIEEATQKAIADQERSERRDRNQDRRNNAENKRQERQQNLSFFEKLFGERDD